MGFRFRRSIKILPGIRLNFGKRGVSTSCWMRAVTNHFIPELIAMRFLI
jgi:hypothetical protein